MVTKDGIDINITVRIHYKMLYSFRNLYIEVYNEFHTGLLHCV